MCDAVPPELILPLSAVMYTLSSLVVVMVFYTAQEIKLQNERFKRKRPYVHKCSNN